MPVWRCPHCGTPQAESSRCWVCRRSTTSCASCRHFRRGVASGLGLCGLDPMRVALTGAEMRACWMAPDPLVETEGPRLTAVGPDRRGGPDDTGERRPRTFIPVDELERPSDPTPVPVAPVVAPAPAAWSLWGDADLPAPLDRPGARLG